MLKTACLCSVFLFVMPTAASAGEAPKTQSGWLSPRMGRCSWAASPIAA